MSFEFDIEETTDLGSGYRLIATGFRGTGWVTDPTDYVVATARSGRTEEVSSAALLAALERAEMREEQEIELELIPETGVQPMTSAEDADAIVLQTPDLGEDRGQVVMLTDEDGGISFHYPVQSETDQELQVPSVRGSEGTKTFVIPAEVTPGSAPEVGTASLIGFVGRKIVHVLSFPVARVIGARLGEPLVRRWERANRPYQIRMFGPDDFQRGDGREVKDWGDLAGARSLLFIHGTFSTAPGGFGAIPRPVMEHLWDRYGGRVLAFNHPSLSADPIENAGWFVDRIPQDVRLDLDIVAHSRGGLVARVLAGGSPASGIDLSRVHVNGVVCAATPNYGTPLADAEHLSSLCDRLATAANLIPGVPVVEMLDAVLLLVQLIAQAVLEGLRGLEVMRPGNDFLHTINTADPGDTTYFGLAANYQPTQRGLKRVIEGLKDGAIDFVFRGVQNDLVVPTVGVYSGGHPFAIDSANVVAFDETRGVTHATLWGEPEVARAFTDWLSG